MTELLSNVTVLQVISGLLLIIISWMMFEYYKVSETLQLSVNVNTELDDRIEKLDLENKRLLAGNRLLEENIDKLENSVSHLKSDNNTLNFKLEKLTYELNTLNNGSRPVTKSNRGRSRKPQSNGQS